MVPVAQMAIVSQQELTTLKSEIGQLRDDVATLKTQVATMSSCIEKFLQAFTREAPDEDDICQKARRTSLVGSVVVAPGSIIAQYCNDCCSDHEEKWPSSRGGEDNENARLTHLVSGGMVAPNSMISLSSDDRQSDCSEETPFTECDHDGGKMKPNDPSPGDQEAKEEDCGIFVSFQTKNQKRKARQAAKRALMTPAVNDDMVISREVEATGGNSGKNGNGPRADGTTETCEAEILMKIDQLKTSLSLLPPDVEHIEVKIRSALQKKYEELKELQGK